MTDNAGGWCVPSAMLYDMPEPIAPISGDFPVVSVARGGIRFEPPTEAAIAANERYREMIAAVGARIKTAQDYTINEAIAVALANRWDLHIYHHAGTFSMRPDGASLIITGRIGIGFKPAEYDIPAMHHHDSHDVSWMDDDEFDPW